MAGRIMKTKGAHGWLYLYRITYRDLDPACPDFNVAYWAYDREHALDKFWDDGDDGWKVLKVTKVKEAVR